MSLLILTLLGAFQLIDDEAQVILEQARLPELLAYITLHRRQPISRQSLAFLLWPDSPEGQARTNLRNLLFKLRTTWPRSQNFLDVSRAEIRWKDEHPCNIDVIEFEAALASSAKSVHPQQKEAALRRALGLYKGDLLPHLYEDWVLAERERLRWLCQQAQETLVLLLEEGRRYEEAIGEAQRLISRDPLRETSYHHLIRLYAARGDRAAALRAYHDCASILQHELGVQPSPITQAIHNRLLNQACLLVVGTLRSEEVDAHHPLNRMLTMLRQDDLLGEIELGSLTPEEIATLAAQTSGSAIPPIGD